MLIAWLVYGIDLPYWDDWRDYRTGNVARLDWTYLFTPANDTMYPVGRALDALSFRYMHGNAVAYQAISMAVIFGSLLALTAILLRRCTANWLGIAPAFALLMFLLQPGTYWGEQSLAYHQAIPLVCLLAIMAVATAEAWIGAVRFVFCLVLALLGGLTYTSGAFGGLGMACAMLLIGALAADYRRAFVWSGLGTLVGATITTSLQAWVILGYQAGHIHKPDARWATPLDIGFWGYLVGKIGRSLMLIRLSDAIGFAISVALLTLVVAAVVKGLYLLIKRRGLPNERAAYFIFIPLAAAIGIYLIMVTSSRVFLDGGERTLLGYYTYAFGRFHHFWVCAIWPFMWVIASQYTRRTAVMPALSAVLVVFGISQGVVSHLGYFKSISDRRTVNELPCLREAIRTGNDAVCAGSYPITLKPALLYASDNDASFTRTLGKYEASGDPIDLTKVVAVNAQVGDISASRIVLYTRVDPWLTLDAGLPRIEPGCKRIQVVAHIAPERDDRAQIYFSGPDGIISEAKSYVVPIKGGQSNRVVFDIINAGPVGKTMRLDPVFEPQQLSISDLSVRCVRLLNG